MILKYVICCAVSAVFCSLLPEKDLLDHQFGTIIHKIAEKYFLKDKPIAIQTTDSYSCVYKNISRILHEQNMFDLLSKEYQLITFGCVDDGIDIRNYQLKAGSAIIMLPEVFISTQIRVSSSIIIRMISQIGEPLRHVILMSSYMSTSHREQKKIALELLNIQWKRLFLAEVIVLLPQVRWTHVSRNKLPEIEVFGWYMEKQHVRCLKEVTDVTLMDRWIDQDTPFRYNNNLFPIKKVTNLHSCYLKVHTGRFEPYVLFLNWKAIGVLPELFNIIGKELNAKFIFGDFTREEADLYIPIWLADNRYVPDDCLIFSTFTIDGLYWYVPVIQIPRWQALIRAFDYLMWIFVTLAFIFGFLTFWLMSKIQYPNQTSLSKIFIDTLLTYTGNGITYKYKGGMYSIFFIFWIFYCLQIYTTYQSQLFGMLTYTGEFPPIQSEEELNKSGYGKYTSVVKEPVPFEYPYISLNNALKSMYQNRNMSVIACSNFIDIHLQYIYTDGGKPQIVKIEKPVLIFYMGFYSKLKCIISKRIYSLLKQLHYNGYYQHVAHNVFNYFRETTIEEKKNLVVDLSNLQAVFYVWFVGLFIASLVCICEIMNYIKF
ncbi:hypothetical protein L9F63_019141 [Diploptera punctata]|uniref:Uncharacterized protein n=1 Tax=Diploptera punctata TaxID=6984 RepID=A0AAD8EEP7_DIPPU|nr:hypothetical protein L9F63_019141 [Diploptera punctata]